MAIAPTVEHELVQNPFPYTLVNHRPTDFSLETARAAHVAPERVAKGVLLVDDYGYVLAVIPADAYLDLTRLQLQLGRDLELAPEADTAALFYDCRFGAVPAVGPAYGVETWIDEALTRQPDIYFEAGDHESLVHLSLEAFQKLMGPVNYGRLTSDLR